MSYIITMSRLTWQSKQLLRNPHDARTPSNEHSPQSTLDGGQQHAAEKGMILRGYGR